MRTVKSLSVLALFFGRAGALHRPIALIYKFNPTACRSEAAGVSTI